MYPKRLRTAATSMTPQVQKKTDQGIPRLLSGPGDSATAGSKNTQATTAAIFASRTSRRGPVASEAFMRANLLKNAHHWGRASGLRHETMTNSRRPVHVPG